MKCLENMALFDKSECNNAYDVLWIEGLCITHSIFVYSGNATDTRGTAFVVYEDIYDAKNACEHLQGFNILGRYLIVLYYQQNKVTKKMNIQKKEEEIKEMKA
jgi:RNA recognition motif-containing protein